MPVSDQTLEQLRGELSSTRRDLDCAQARLRDAQLVGIAVGMLLARTPGWTEQDALAAWDVACAKLTRGGHTRALASYVIQTGTLPGDCTSLVAPAQERVDD